MFKNKIFTSKQYTLILKNVNIERNNISRLSLGLCERAQRLSKIKAKIAFNLTNRQLISFGDGGLVGNPAIPLTRGAMGNTAALFLMLAVMLRRSCLRCMSGTSCLWRRWRRTSSVPSSCAPDTGPTRRKTSTPHL